MNKKLLVAFAAAAVAASSASFALDKQGFYVGADLGASRADDGDAFENAAKAYPSYEVKQNGFGWRAFAGYNFSRNFAVEGGYTQYADNTYKAGIGAADAFDLTHKTSAWDLVAKAALPLADSNWDVYAKGGVAYQKTEYKGSMLGDSGSDSRTDFRPIAGAGVAYNFDNGVTVDLSWTRVFGNGKTELRKDGLNQPDSDLVSVGLIYNFQNWA